MDMQKALKERRLFFCSAAVFTSLLIFGRGDISIGFPLCISVGITAWACTSSIEELGTSNGVKAGFLTVTLTPLLFAPLFWLLTIIHIYEAPEQGSHTIPMVILMFGVIIGICLSPIAMIIGGLIYREPKEI